MPWPMLSTRPGARNARLNARLLTIEENERRRLAGELHDELGPLMFGLKAGADSLARLSAQAQPELAARMASRAAGLIDIVERMQGANRRLLRRIRPAALGHVPLADVLASLLADFRQHDPERAFLLEAGPLRDHYDAALEATLYRCAQEAITNALLHGEARTVRLTVGEAPAATPGALAASPATVLRLLVRDDGRGPPAALSSGLGLAGMRERVRALGGVCGLAADPRGGAVLTVEIPLPMRGADRPGADEPRP